MKKSKPKSKLSPVKLLALMTLATLSVKAIGYIRSEEDALALAWGMPLERHLSLLTETGKLDEKHTPWGDFNWPTSKGSIGYRWLKNDESPLAYPILTLPAIQKLSNEERRARIKELSPAEKLDVVRMQFSYPLLGKIRADLHRAKDSEDSNLEIGWAIASTHLLEPVDTVVKLKLPHARDPRQWLDVEVPFASSDVKALLAYYFGVQAAERVQRYQVGSNCSGAPSEKCAGIDPASFHILLTNMIGKTGRSFVLDMDGGEKTTHRPVVAYESDIRYQTAGNYRVTTKVEVARIRAPEWNAYEFYNLDTEPHFYEYTLEVNTRGEIVRGQWLSPARPEFAWRSDLPSVDKDFRALAEQIYQPLKKTRDLSAIEKLFE